MSTTPEQIYDEQIAPKLLAVMQACGNFGFSFVASCEWGPGESAESASIREDSSFAIRMAQAAISAHGNVDSLLFALMRHATKHGHSSMLLKQLGVPLAPSKLGDEVEL